jgi:hypothetical protein
MKKRPNAKWFDRDCSQMKISLQRIGFVNSPFDQSVGVNFFNYKKMYKNSTKARKIR